MLELDDFVQVLVLEKECEGQVASHVPVGLVLALLGQPSLILQSLHFLILKLFVLFKLKRELLLLVFLDKLKVVAGLILVDIDV